MFIVTMGGTGATLVVPFHVSCGYQNQKRNKGDRQSVSLYQLSLGLMSQFYLEHLSF